MTPTMRTPFMLRAAAAALALVAAAAATAAATDAQTRALQRSKLTLSPEAQAAIRGDAPTPDMTRKAIVGGKIFKDTSLSQPPGQSCESCHRKDRTFTDKGVTSHGADPTLFGPRNAPAIGYGMFTPPLQSGGDEGPLSFFGGQFRDGRANFLADQAKLPILNPIEMGNPDVATVVAKLAAAPYAEQFKAAYGADIFSDPDAAFQAMANAIARFESSREFAPFSSKYDAYLRGETTLTDAEARALALFTDPDRADCANCHVATATPVWGNRPLFTDYGFDNIGIPRNPDNKFYSMPAQYNPDGRDYVDQGLGAIVPRDSTIGQFKSSSLRNVAVTGPYGHNGYFKTLRGIVDFYNTRDVKPRCPNKFTREADAIAQGCWPVAEYPKTMNTVNLGNIGLSDQEVDDIVTFLGTLTDGWKPTAGTKGHAAH